MNCQFTESSPGVLVCDECGRLVRTSKPIDRIQATCGAARSRGLGDVLAWLLARLGFARWWHRKQPGCGCVKRRDALNRAVPF